MKKQPGSKQDTMLVTFAIPAAVGAASGSVCGEFNEWLPNANPLERTADGGLETTVELQAGRAWRFRYLLDGDRWENDWEADGYLANDFGGDDSVLDLTTVETAPRKATKRAATRRSTPKAEAKPTPEKTAAKPTGTKKAATARKSATPKKTAK